MNLNFEYTYHVKQYKFLAYLISLNVQLAAIVTCLGLLKKIPVHGSACSCLCSFCHADKE